MRKRLLRSRTGFEKPGSREEAIMQNILGASNVLEPSESNIEEILKSILYNTPYTKEAEFEIEKILLAIKNNGTYDGEGESRDMKILIAILKDLDYTEEAESRIEELFIEWLHQRSSIKVLEGVPPLTFTSCGLPLINYQIDGNTVQSGTPTPDNPIQPQETGDRTGNLLDWSYFKDGYYLDNATGLPAIYTPSPSRIATTSPIDVSNYNYVTFSFTTNVTVPLYIYSLFNGNTLIRRVSNNSNGASIDVSEGDKLYLCIYSNSSNITTSNINAAMLNGGSTAQPYEPFGYKIPISSGGVTTNIYLGSTQTVRRIKKLVLDGTEDLTFSISDANRTVCSLTNLGCADALCLCTHIEGKLSYSSNEYNRIRTFTVLNGVLYISIEKGLVGSTLETFKAYLAAQYTADTPVTIYYVLATAETTTVNEPIRKIGNYADTLSMEQAGVEIPTNNGSTTLDVDTTVKPSNIYIEYK